MRSRHFGRSLSLVTLWFIVVCVHFGYAQAQALPATDPDAAQVPAPPPHRSSSPARELAPEALLAELRKGGYVWYFRHAATDFNQNDKASRSFEDCANQRNLIERGRAEARAIGEAIRQLQIPIGRVLASPLCRTMETARLIFGQAEASLDTRAQRVTKPGDDRFAPLHRLLVAPQPPGANLIIVSHGNPFYGTAGPPYLTEGEVAIVRGLGADFEVIARLRPEGWKALRR
jgi:phosphohistidine phosphatase SixA